MAFPPSRYGIYDMIGNVWEWTSDWWSAKHEADADKACCIPKNPRGGREEESYDPASRRSTRCSKAARICARRTTAAATARRRATRRRWIRRQAISASDASAEDQTRRDEMSNDGESHRAMDPRLTVLPQK
jgi:formylglycine-generating enzyme